MYLLYSLLIARRSSPWSRRTSSTRRFATGSTSEACAQRLGYLPVSFNLDGDESIWIHAVSVGEVLDRPGAHCRAARALPAPPPVPLDDDDDGPAGRAANILQHVDAVFYFPFDCGFIVRRTLDLVRPRLFIMMETEIWPNLLRACRPRAA